MYLRLFFMRFTFSWEINALGLSDRGGPALDIHGIFSKKNVTITPPLSFSRWFNQLKPWFPDEGVFFFVSTGGTLPWSWCQNGLSLKVIQVCKCMIMRFTLSCKSDCFRNVSELRYNSCWPAITTLSYKTKHPVPASISAPDCGEPPE